MNERRRLYLLSPANASGIRAGYLLRAGAAFDLAVRFQSGQAALGEVFAFCSGLYFRGKLAYVDRFAPSDNQARRAYVITPSRGLMHPCEPMAPALLREFSRVPVALNEARYASSLRDSLSQLESLETTEAVLLGSIATGKYVDLLLPYFGSRLLFPKEFVGRGDMSRGGLMLRAAASGVELEYVPVLGAARVGMRPAKLPPTTGSPRKNRARKR